MQINGFNLPLDLEQDLDRGGRRLTEAGIVKLAALLTRLEKPAPKLYDLDQVRRESRFWETEEAHFYLGTPSSVYHPGNVDPLQTLIIGMAEPDSPIALDFRTEPPRVVYFGDADGQTYWFELAPSYSHFTARIEK